MTGPHNWTHPAPLAVHVLHYGLPLCRFTTDLPIDWPHGHKWVGLDDIGVATCPECLHIALLPAPKERTHDQIT